MPAMDTKSKVHLIIADVGEVAFDSIEDAMAVGRNLYRAGEEVRIEIPDAPNHSVHWRYEPTSDEWLECVPGTAVST